MIRIVTQPGFFTRLFLFVSPGVFRFAKEGKAQFIYELASSKQLLVVLYTYQNPINN